MLSVTVVGSQFMRYRLFQRTTIPGKFYYLPQRLARRIIQHSVFVCVLFTAQCFVAIDQDYPLRAYNTFKSRISRTEVKPQTSSHLLNKHSFPSLLHSYASSFHSASKWATRSQKLPCCTTLKSLFQHWVQIMSVRTDYSRVKYGMCRCQMPYHCFSLCNIYKQKSKNYLIIFQNLAQTTEKHIWKIAQALSFIMHYSQSYINVCRSY